MCTLDQKHGLNGELCTQKSLEFVMVRQGSVLSPSIFTIYLDDLLKELRQQGLDCYMGGLWIGAVAFEDDLLLMAPNRSAIAKMLEIFENYGNNLNLVFSTDNDPLKSKTIFMTGQRLRNVPKPSPLCLYEKNLPWVSHASHLGHELHDDGYQDFVCRMNTHDWSIDKP